MKGLPICFSEVQVKNDVTDNNNKHFVTAFEGECRNIIELREHLKLCFLIILGVLQKKELLSPLTVRKMYQWVVGLDLRLSTAEAAAAVKLRRMSRCLYFDFTVHMK